jgi:hypothetical protein
MPVGEQISAFPASPPLIGTELVPVVIVGVITAITQAASAVVTISNASVSNPLSVGQDAAFSGVGGMTQINSLHGIVSAIGGSAGAWTITVPINSSAFSAYTSGGELTSTVAATSGALGLPVRSAAEIAAGAVPANYFYRPLDPLRYGAIGDGTTDDTAAMNKWAAVINAAGVPVTSIWTAGKVYLCGPITTITANDVTILMNGCTIKVKPDSWPTGNLHVNITGVRTRINQGVLDGNQSAFTVTPPGGGYLLVLSNDFQLNQVTVKNSAAIGFNLTSIAEGTAEGCHFDSNANLGSQIAACSYLRFIGCSWNYNGYGFHQTLATNAFTAFGVVQRFRCHHIDFIGCEALQNGRDGFCTNQGSYASKYIGCLAWMNGDGGFTMAADSTSIGTTGNAEVPYDLEFIDCESYNNYTSGLASYCASVNVTVLGGRYYNNHRLAGLLPDQSSYNNGIYFSPGCNGIVVNAKAYDDRQLRLVTAASVSGTSCTVTATGWVAGSMANYPQVAFYDAAMTFQGYGTLTAESSGSVTVQTAANNGVTLASIVGFWYVSQKVQHNGCFFDNGCIATAAIDGFGTLAGVQNYYGYKIVSGFNTNGQNVLVPQYPLDPNVELLLNPSFEADTSNWSLTPASGGSAGRVTTTRRSVGSLQLVGGGSASSTGNAQLDTNALLYAANAFVEFSMWVFANGFSDGGIVLDWIISSTNITTTVNHPGGGWRKLVIGAFIPAAATGLIPSCFANAGKTCYFDVGSLRVREVPTDNRDVSYPSRNLPV